ENRTARRCPSAPHAQMQSAPPYARPSSTCSRGKSIGWASSYAPSALPEPASRSAWPTWPITSSASLGSRDVLRPHDTKSGPRDRSGPQNQPVSTGKMCPAAPARAPKRHHTKIIRFFEVSKWHGTRYRLLQRYRSGFEDNRGEEFDAPFVRLDWIA